MSDTLILIILGICSYFFGNINWAIVISKFKKTDIRKLGSGNPGTLRPVLCGNKDAQPVVNSGSLY